MTRQEYHKKYRLEHRDKALQYSRKYYIKNKEMYRLYGAKYYTSNKQKILLRNRSYRRLNSIKYRISKKKYYQRNRSEILQKSALHQRLNRNTYSGYNRKWRLKNIEKCRQSYRKRRAENLEAERLRARQYYKNHPEKIMANCAIRRARQVASTLGSTKLILDWRNRIRSTYFVRCYWCENILDGKAVHFDHVIALSRGGTHSIGNLCASCPDCNFSKNGRAIQKWFKLKQLFLPI